MAKHSSILIALDFASVNAELAPDTRRMMAAEAMSIRAAAQRGDAEHLAAVVAEAKRVAEMWAVSL